MTDLELGPSKYDRQFLRPEDSPFGLPLTTIYFHLINKTLMDPEDPKRRGLISVVCLPSFDVEWTLRLLGSEKKGYLLLLSIADEKIWLRRSATPIPVTHREAKLPSKIAKSICEAWKQMLLRVRHPQRPTLGLDGVSYHFHFSDGHWMAGKTWSPHPETAPGKLVALSELLYEFVAASAAERRELVRKIAPAADDVIHAASTSDAQNPPVITG